MNALIPSKKYFYFTSPSSQGPQQTLGDEFQLNTGRIHFQNLNLSQPGSQLNPLDEDYIRITSCPAYRRLQDKTQLFPLEKNDYARTRLTHSSEVSSCARAIATAIVDGISSQNASVISPEDRQTLISAAGNCALLHDIGNPPFGHYGEQIIRDFFMGYWGSSEAYMTKSGEKIPLLSLLPINEEAYYDFVAFDGNAQALRVVTKLENFHGDHGLDLTFATLGGLVKYPYSSLVGWKEGKFGYFQSEKDVIDKLAENKVFKEGKRNPISMIMEAADDISMMVSDFEDGIKKDCITYNTILTYKSTRNDKEKMFKRDFVNLFDSHHWDTNNQNDVLIAASNLLYEAKTSLIKDCASLFCQENTLDQLVKGTYSVRYRNEDQHALVYGTSNFQIMEMVRRIIEASVFTNRQIVTPELEGHEILTFLLSLYVNALMHTDLSEGMPKKAKATDEKVLHLLSKDYFEVYHHSVESLKKTNQYDDKKEAYLRLRLAVDQVCGMTDTFARDLYCSLK
jgi:dGTPase